MSYTLDTNILIYAFDRTTTKQGIARKLLAHLLEVGGVCPRQVLGEWLNLAHRKRVVPLETARTVVAAIEDSLTVIDTTAAAMAAASRLAERYQLQFFDALICTVANDAGCTTLFSEDMQDGVNLSGLAIVDPFAETNASIVAQCLRKTL